MKAYKPIKKLDWYIIRKFLGTFIFSILLIIMVAVIFDLSEKLDDFLEKEAPIKAIFLEYYLNFIPYFAILFSYLFTFIAVIFFTSKMAYDTEIIAILSGGVSFRRLMYPYFLSALVIAAASFYLSNYVIPKANLKRFQFEEKYYYNNPFRYERRNIHKQIEPNVFIYLESYNNYSDIGNRFAMERFENGELRSKMISEYMRWDSIKNKWKVHNYFIRDIDGLKETVRSGRVIDTTINLLPTEFDKRDNVVEAMTLSDLNETIRTLKSQGSSTETISIERAKRFAFPFASFILTLIGVSVSSRKIRGGMGGHLALGVAMSFGYILFMQFSQQFAIGGYLGPNFAVWIPNLIFLAIGGVLYYLAPK